MKSCKLALFIIFLLSVLPFAALAQRPSLNKLNAEVNQLQAMVEDLQAQIDASVDHTVLKDGSGEVLGPAFPASVLNMYPGWSVWLRDYTRPVRLVARDAETLTGTLNLSHNQLLYELPGCNSQPFLNLFGIDFSAVGLNAETFVAEQVIWAVVVPTAGPSSPFQSAATFDSDGRLQFCQNAPASAPARALEEIGPIPEFTPPLRLE